MRLQTGTDSVAGILASWCTGRKCSTPAGAAPKRWLPLDEQGLMLFATGIEPESASVEVRARGHRVAKGRIEPATLMTWRAHLPRGRYVVTLIERWDDRVARWLFGVKVEPPND